MISISKGLTNSLIVLEFLRNNEEIQNIHISVGTFTNCRECGLTFMVMSATHEGEYVNVPPFTWCIYEHRNSDQIIINGVNRYVSLNGDLPFKADSKSIYLYSFKYNQHMEAADQLATCIKDWVAPHLATNKVQ